MLHRLRRVSAAAHGANIAQPALSEQLRKLETALGGTLFERHSDGLVPTTLGERFAPIAQMLEASMREIVVSGASTFVPAAKRLALGVLPSVSQHGLLVNKIAEAVIEGKGGMIVTDEDTAEMSTEQDEVTGAAEPLIFTPGEE